MKTTLVSPRPFRIMNLAQALFHLEFLKSVTLVTQSLKLCVNDFRANFQAQPGALISVRELKILSKIQGFSKRG